VSYDDNNRDPDSPDFKRTRSETDTASPGDPGSGEGPAAESGQELDDWKAKAASYLDLAQRTQADFLNYKRRIEQDRSDYARSARADILLRVLPAIDDLDLAVNSVPTKLADEEWTQGVVHIDRKLRSALESLGLKPIEPVGKPFDPWQQEGVGHEPSETVPADAVTRVVRTGYILDGKVIRPAQVLLSSGPPEPTG